MNKLQYLTDRDIDILMAIDSFALVSTSQIKKAFFPDTSKRTMLKRLQFLTQKNFVRYTEGLPRGERSWYLTKSAHDFLGTDSVIKSVNKNTLYHDMRVNDLMIQLSDIGHIDRWKSGHHWKQEISNDPDISSHSSRSIVPDCSFTINSVKGLKNVAIELELSKKAKKRYIYKFYDYTDRHSNFQWIWYIVPTKKFVDHLLKLITNEYERRKLSVIGISVIDEVMADPEHAPIYSLQNTSSLHKICTYKEPEMEWHCNPHRVINSFDEKYHPM